MKQSELFEFACQCLLPDKNTGQKKGIEEKFISGEVDLNRFVFLCSNHLVLPAIYLRLKDAGLIELFPNEYVDHLKEIYETNKKRNRDILLQIDEISSRLKKENIEPLYLKGTANLMDNLYSDLGVRMIGDIDFLVQEKDYLKTVDLILDLGYENQHKMYEDAKSFKHYPRLFRKDVPADIEIHRVPVNIQYSKQFHTDLLFQHKKAIKNRSNCFVSSDEHKLIHTFIHSQLSNKGHKRITLELRDLYDAQLLLKRVDVNSVLPQVEEKIKARDFFEYVNYLFNPEQISLSDKLPNNFAVRHQWFLNHSRWHRTYLNILNFYELIIIRYLWRIIRAPFQKSSMRYLYVRLKDPKWYKMHFKGVRDSFRR